MRTGPTVAFRGAILDAKKDMPARESKFRIPGVKSGGDSGIIEARLR